MSEPTDEEYFRRFRRGDDGALSSLVRRHARGAARFAAGILRDAHEAEDVAQESFLKLVAGGRSGASFDPDRGGFAPYFFRLVRNLALDRVRSRRAAGAIEENHEAPAASSNGAVRAERRERRARVADLVRDLPDGERAALVLREFEGLSYRDIALVLGSSVECVKVWIYRARQKLTRGLETEVPRERPRSKGVGSGL